MKAVSLFSGGLDSQLAVCLIKDQGIEVIGVNFVTPFFGAEERFRLAAEQLGIDYHEINIGDIYMDVLKNPVYGYGKNFNPCIDCHGFMLKKAGIFMQEIGASFLVTGEVMGERPMSQNKSSLAVVEKLSGYKGLVLRPLSAKLLPPTIPEIEGWVDRSKLLAISGRSRTPQMKLAEHYGLKDYPTPAGGCLLTQVNFSKRLRKLLAIKPMAAMDEMELLKVGRHFYITDDQLLIVGRNHAENERLHDLAGADDYLFKVISHPGPLGLIRVLSQTQPVDFELPASIIARYSDARDLPLAKVEVKQPGDNNPFIIEVIPLSASSTMPMV
ncbi:MAG: tRNA 4-thiouridine(8) synthase ThiI [Syntrophomonas sp.]|nr:tRNA 4-thiouridine(8) synthase ThiI [Syntrophomonas sp.]